MGAYNILKVCHKCVNCGNMVLQEVQFKYGNLDRNVYRLGDAINWGGESEGEANADSVVIDAALDYCPICSYEDENYLVFAKRNNIVGTGHNDGHHRFLSNKPYLKLE